MKMTLLLGELLIKAVNNSSAAWKSYPHKPDGKTKSKHSDEKIYPLPFLAILEKFNMIINANNDPATNATNDS